MFLERGNSENGVESIYTKNEVTYTRILEKVCKGRIFLEKNLCEGQCGASKQKFVMRHIFLPSKRKQEVVLSFYEVALERNWECWEISKIAEEMYDHFLDEPLHALQNLKLTFN